MKKIKSDETILCGINDLINNDSIDQIDDTLKTAIIDPIELLHIIDIRPILFGDGESGITEMGSGFKQTKVTEDFSLYLKMITHSRVSDIVTLSEIMRRVAIIKYSKTNHLNINWKDSIARAYRHSVVGRYTICDKTEIEQYPNNTMYEIDNAHQLLRILMSIDSLMGEFIHMDKDLSEEFTRYINSEKANHFEMSMRRIVRLLTELKNKNIDISRIKIDRLYATVCNPSIMINIDEKIVLLCLIYIVAIGDMNIWAISL